MDKDGDSLSDIVTFIGFVALVSIIFGVSMHDAFWGIVGFFVVLVVGCIAFWLIKYGLIALKYKLKNIQTQPKKEPEIQEAVIVKKKSTKPAPPAWMIILCIIFLAIWFAWPFIGLFIVAHLNELSPSGLMPGSPLTGILIILVPFLTPFIIRRIIINKRNKNKKHAKRKS